ncbi:MAG: hypothetical protein QXT77_07030 [Candidatus Methanomethylicaceae archaeon]
MSVRVQGTAMRSENHRSGFVIMIVLFFAVILALSLFAAAPLVTIGSKRVHTIAALKQAHYLAEIGIEEAISSPLLFWREFSPASPIELGNGRVGRYTAVARRSNDTIELESRGYVSVGDQRLAEKAIVCKLRMKLVSAPGPWSILSNAIATSGNLNSGKVYVYLDEGVPPDVSADIYSDAEITNLAGEVPGSVFAQGRVVLNNGTLVKRDVIAKGDITLNNNTQVLGSIISAEGYVDVNNKVKVDGDIVAYGVDSKGYSVYIANSEVRDIYTQEGKTQVKLAPSARYNLIGKISDSPYPEAYVVPRRSLPVIDEGVRSMWIEMAKSDNLIYQGLTVNNNENFLIRGNAFIQGNLVLNQNAVLNIEEGSILYVTGRVIIENNALIRVLDANGDEKINFGSSLIAEDYFDVRNRAIPESVSLVALGTSTSYLRNNSVTTGAILVPNGKLEISNNAEVHGAIFAKEITKIGNNAEVYYNPLKAASTLPPIANTPLASVLSLVEWIEK